MKQHWDYGYYENKGGLINYYDDNKELEKVKIYSNRLTDET